MCNDIINNLPATEAQVRLVAAKGYDVKSRALTRGDVQAVIKDLEKRGVSVTFNKNKTYKK
jgi:uncharacterized Zn ribbon protein